MAVVRRAFQTRRVGHTGTLDPFATGLLVILVGRATRLAQYLVGMPKEYTGTVRLGVSTTTDDATGETIEQSDAWTGITEEAIAQAMGSFIGTVDQRPPRFSAKSVDGRRAYARARRGEVFELEHQAVQIDRFDLLGREGPDLRIRVAVGSGVYIRSLARDLGEKLGCGAHLTVLRRTRVGPFRVNDAASVDEVKAGGVVLRPAGDAVAHLETRQIDEPERVFIRNGRAIPDGGTVRTVALFASGDLVAVAESDGILLHPSVVLEQ